jgi:hypothetical protein
LLSRNASYVTAIPYYESVAGAQVVCLEVVLDDPMGVEQCHIRFASLPD